MMVQFLDVFFYSIEKILSTARVVQNVRQELLNEFQLFTNMDEKMRSLITKTFGFSVIAYLILHSLPRNTNGDEEKKMCRV